LIRAPASGEIVLIGEGQVLIETKSDLFQLRAGLSGVVTQLIPERGAVIEATGALIQGVWGNGHLEYGLAHAKINDPGDKLIADNLDVSLRGAITVAGYCNDPAVLHSAAEIPLRGLVLSSMSSSLIPLAAKMPYPILVLEGFGYLPMNSSTFKLLLSNQNREMSINAEHIDRFKGIRPEVVIPLPSQSTPQPPLEEDEFKPGQEVRLLRAPHPAEIATLETLHPKPMVFPSGIRAPAADVRLEGKDILMVPLANLEILA
jgi:hypothetical protein